MARPLSERGPERWIDQPPTVGQEPEGAERIAEPLRRLKSALSAEPWPEAESWRHFRAHWTALPVRSHPWKRTVLLVAVLANASLATAALNRGQFLQKVLWHWPQLGSSLAGVTHRVWRNQIEVPQRVVPAPTTIASVKALETSAVPTTAGAGTQVQRVALGTSTFHARFARRKIHPAPVQVQAAVVAPALRVGPMPANPMLADPMAAELALFSRALEQFRSAGDLHGALETLEEYRQRYPNGILRTEADVTEIDLQLALGRRPSALALLNAMETRGFAGVPRAAELRLLRAELLGHSGRCGETLSILQTHGYLDSRVPLALRERALFDRAICRTTLGDASGARSDLRLYLDLYPSGPHASEIERRLGTR